MILTLIRGQVVCSLEQKNSAYLADCTDLYKGYYSSGYLKFNAPFSADYRTEDEYVIEYYNRLKLLIELSEKHGITIAESIRQLAERGKARVDGILNRRKVADEYFQKLEKWKKLQANGCDGCQHLCRCADDFMCWASKDLLPERNEPENGYLFVWRAYPTDNCPYKITDGQYSEKEIEEYEHRKLMEKF